MMKSKSKTKKKTKSLSITPSGKAKPKTGQLPTAAGMTEVKSSNIQAVKFGGDILVVQFKNGKVFAYDGVPQETFDEMMKSESLGSYFAQHIKGKFNETQDEFSKEEANANNASVEGADKIEPSESVGDVKEDYASESDQSASPEPDAPDETAPNPGDDVNSPDDDSNETDGTTAPVFAGSFNDGAGASLPIPSEPIPAKVVKRGQAAISTLAQAANMDKLRAMLQEIGVDVQYERAEDKQGVKHWNYTASVEKADRSVQHTGRIDEHATPDEVKSVFDEIVLVFVKAS